MDTLISVCHQLSVAQLVERWTVVGLSQSHPSVTGLIPVWEILSFLGKWQTAKMISCWMGCRKSKFKHQVLCQAGSEFGWFFHVLGKIDDRQWDPSPERRTFSIRPRKYHTNTHTVDWTHSMMCAMLCSALLILVTRFNVNAATLLIVIGKRGEGKLSGSIQAGVGV